MRKEKTRPRKTTERTPVQSRGIQTREKIIQSGEKLFAQYGFHDTLADDIAKEAGVSVGSFYAYFKDKYDLFLMIIDRHSERTTAIVAEWSQSFAKHGPVDAEDFIRNAVAMSVSAHKASSPLFRQAMQMALSDEAIRERLTEKTDRVVRQLFEEMLLRMNAHLDRNKVQTIAYVLYHASEGVIHEMMLHEGEVNEQEVIMELSRLLTAYMKEIGTSYED
jgi:AcrR family transcriptional regulator